MPGSEYQKVGVSTSSLTVLLGLINGILVFPFFGWSGRAPSSPLLLAALVCVCRSGLRGCHSFQNEGIDSPIAGNGVMPLVSLYG